jgi:hypothetical protein
MVNCVICLTPVREDRSIQAPCAHSHHYDFACAKELFLLATRDESLHPPRCDGVAIPLALVRPHLTRDELALYTRKAAEFGTANRLYCSTATCSEFLGAVSTSRIPVKCDKCKTSTCEACKAPWHGLFGACASLEDDEVVNALARDYNYQRCPTCRRLVELAVGCYHMYVVSVPFRPCALADAIWLAQDVPLPWTILLRLRGALENVRVSPVGRVNHDCAHASWQHRIGGGQCETCFHHLPSYLFVRLDLAFQGE